jgi:hypothetical protein
MGIGGLDTEFAAIFRRAFASRIFPPGLVEKLGIQHVKGEPIYKALSTPRTDDRYFAIWTSWYRKNLNGKADWKNA